MTADGHVEGFTNASSPYVATRPEGSTKKFSGWFVVNEHEIRTQQAATALMKQQDPVDTSRAPGAARSIQGAHAWLQQRSVLVMQQATARTTNASADFQIPCLSLGKSTFNLMAVASRAKTELAAHLALWT